MKYKTLVTQTNEFEVIIEADSFEEAGTIFDEMLVEDFGEPVNSELKYHGLFTKVEE